MKEQTPAASWIASLQSDTKLKKDILPQEHVLQNGLRILTLSTPDYETARVHVTVNAGAGNDAAGYEGTAHYLEHMMFNGSILHRDKHPREDLIGQWGGKLNARTSNMQTEFYTSSAIVAQRKGENPVNHLDETIDMVLDLVQHPRLQVEEVKRERGVIMAELAQALNKPDLTAYQNFMRVAFPDSPVAHPTLGTAESLQKIDANVLRDFWQDHYQPHKTAILVQGPYSHQELLEMVQKHLTVLGSGKPHVPEPVSSWPELQPGHMQTPNPNAHNVCCEIGWNGFRELPGQKESIILSMLGGLTNKILHRELREAGMVYSSNFSANRDGHPTMVSFSTNRNAREVIEKTMDVLSHLETYITQDMWDRLKNEWKLYHIKETDHPLGMAWQKAYAAQTRQLVYPADTREGIYDSITLSEIHEMAARLFSKPCSCALVGAEALLKDAPDAKEIAAMYKGRRSDGPLVGWAEPLKVAPCDIKATEQSPHAASFTRNREANHAAI